MRLSEKLEGVLNNLAALNSESKPTDLIHAAGKAVDLLRNHAEDLRQALRDSERYRAVTAMCCSEEGPSDALVDAWMAADEAAADAAVDSAMGQRGSEGME